MRIVYSFADTENKIYILNIKNMNKNQYTYFKLEDYSTIRLINAQWLGDINDLITIRDNNKKNQRLINSGIPISIEEMNLFIEWVEQGKDQKELQDFFQRKIFSVDKHFRKYKDMIKNRGYKIYNFKNKVKNEILTEDADTELISKLTKDYQKQEDNIQNGRPKNHGLEWDSKSLGELREMFKTGSSIPELTTYFERSVTSVELNIAKDKALSNEGNSNSHSKGEVITQYKKGLLVQQLNNIEWGDGIILNVDNAQIKILFENVGFKEFKLDLVKIKVLQNEVLSDLKIAQWILKSKGVTSLWHITHMDNINSIFLNGVLTHFDINKSHELTYNDISNHDVQARRERPEPIYQRNIHSYVPLFINPKNAMLYLLQRIHRDNLCLIEISLDVLTNRYIFTNGNAARRNSKFFSNLSTQFEQIPWNDVFSKRWVEQNIEYGHSYPMTNEDIKSHMQSEFLISPKIDSKYIKKIHCKNQATVDIVENRLKHHNSYSAPFQVVSNKNAFF